MLDCKLISKHKNNSVNVKKEQITLKWLKLKWILQKIYEYYKYIKQYCAIYNSGLNEYYKMAMTVWMNTAKIL